MNYQRKFQTEKIEIQREANLKIEKLRQDIKNQFESALVDLGFIKKASIYEYFDLQWIIDIHDGTIEGSLWKIPITYWLKEDDNPLTYIPSSYRTFIVPSLEAFTEKINEIINGIKPFINWNKIETKYNNPNLDTIGFFEIKRFSTF